MKVSTRINGRVTSINVRDSVCALHYIICGSDSLDQVENHVLDTCHDIISTWEGDTGRGLSSYITDKMLEDLLDTTYIKSYRSTLQRLSNV